MLEPTTTIFTKRCWWTLAPLLPPNCNMTHNIPILSNNMISTKGLRIKRSYTTHNAAPVLAAF